jgi:hypothetical protein
MADVKENATDVPKPGGQAHGMEKPRPTVGARIVDFLSSVPFQTGEGPITGKEWKHHYETWRQVQSASNHTGHHHPPSPDTQILAETLRRLEGM